MFSLIVDRGPGLMPIPRAFDVDMVFRGHGWLSTRSKPSDPHLVLWIYIHIENLLVCVLRTTWQSFTLLERCALMGRSWRVPVAD